MHQNSLIQRMLAGVLLTSTRMYISCGMGEEFDT